MTSGRKMNCLRKIVRLRHSSRLAETRPLAGRSAALFLTIAIAGGLIATPGMAGSVKPGAGQISFYSDVGNAVGVPGGWNENPLVVRPDSLLLAEDGSVVLTNLQWTGWGTKIAKATGTWSGSDCTPDCATGKRTKRPASLTLSSPGLVKGHRVYRCFKVSPANPQRDMADSGCLHRDGKSYVY